MALSPKIAAEIKRLMRDPNSMRAEAEQMRRSGGHGHYDPNQPRVPAGDSDGGQWTRGGGNAERSRLPNSGPSSSALPSGNPGGAPWTVEDGDSGNVRLASSNPPSRSFARDGGGADQRSSNTRRDDIPIYDTYDTTLLHPKGISSTGGTQTLQYDFGDGHYLGGVTVANADRTWVGRFLQFRNRAPVVLRLDAEIHAADGVSRHSFEIKDNLSPGSSKTIPWKEFGLMRGPGRVVITVTNIGTQSTGVIIGAVKMTNVRGGR